VIISLGLVVRILYLHLIAHQPLVSDAASYNDMAADLVMGRHFVPFWPPGLPLYLAAVKSLFGGSVLAVRLAMLALFPALSFVLYRTTVCLTGEVACGNIALLTLAFSPGMICASVEPVTELPSAMLLTLVACCLLMVKSGDSYYLPLILGTAIGCMALIRPGSLVILLFVPLYLLWRTRNPVPAMVTCLIPAVIVCSWIAYVHQTTGHLVVINTSNAKNLYLGNNPRTPLYRTWWLGSHHEFEDTPTLTPDPIVEQARYSKLAWDYIGQHPGLFLLRSFNRVCVFFAFDTYAGAYLIENYGFPKLVGLAVVALDSAIYCVIGIGCILYIASLSGLSKRSIHGWVLVGLSLVYASPYFLAFSHPRYHFPIEPLLMASAAAFVLPFLKGSIVETPKTSYGRSGGATIAIVLFLLIQIEFVVIIERALLTGDRQPKSLHRPETKQSA
jgi:hypothetical protein